MDPKEPVRRHPSPPRDLQEDAQITQEVATALHEWKQRPEVEPLTGLSAREIEERLRALPTLPAGDVEPAPTVVSAHRSFLQAQDRHQAHALQGPIEGTTVEVGAVSESELIDLARELETPVPSVDSRPQKEAERITHHPVSTKHRALRAPAGIGAAAAVLAWAWLLSIGAIAAGVAVVGVGVGLGIGWVVLLRQSATPVVHGLGMSSAEAKLLVAEQLAALARDRREVAATRAAALGLEPDPATLRRLADEVRRAGQARAERRSWEDRERSLEEAISKATEDLARGLRERGVDLDAGATPDELTTAFRLYEDECRLRREEAAMARERLGLEQALEARSLAETQLAKGLERVDRARQMLQVAAVAAAVSDEHSVVALSEDELLARLSSWQQQHEQQRSAADRARNEWSRLRAILDGSSLDELEARAHTAQERAEALGGSVDEDIVSDISLGDDPDRMVRESREHAEELERQVAAARRELEVRSEQVLSVPEAEEQVAAAQEVLEGVKSLAVVLDTTREFLASAQDRVHRDIAPVLGVKVRDRLTRITEGRYVEVRVDPESLKVRVQEAGGSWRDAEFLSHGTADQIYLLLRVAMAEILTAHGASCPLLLDDTTVQSDPQRTWAILDVLHEVSAEHQVILFSQEADVVAWAEQHLGTRDRLLYLAVEPLQ